MMAWRMQQMSMSMSMSVLVPIILMMISPTHDTSSIYDRVHLIIDASIISNAVIIDVVFNEDRSAMYRRGFGGVRVGQVRTGVCPPDGKPVVMMTGVEVAAAATLEVRLKVESGRLP
jgi:hypothetical protein